MDGVFDALFRESHGKVLAALIAFCRDFSLAEDALQDACLVALKHWPVDGLPSNPPAWLLTTAKNRIIDQVRRDRVLARKLVLLGADDTFETPTDKEVDVIPDERLRLIFTCCHPAIAREAQIALTLRTLGGLSTEDIAHAFLTPVPTMAQRLVRAQRKISDAGIPYRVPDADQLAERVDAVLTVLYLIFNEGYAAASGDALIRRSLCDEAIRLASLLRDLVESDLRAPELGARLPEILGLGALMMLHHARLAARSGPDGRLILLDAQDRARWDHAAISRATTQLERALAQRRPGPYQIQAAIAALHAEARTPAATDWRQISALYGELAKRMPSPIVELNRAIAVAMADGPQRGLEQLDVMQLAESLGGYHHYHATRADFLRRLGNMPEAAAAYRQALALCDNAVEREFLQGRLQTTGDHPVGISQLPAA